MSGGKTALGLDANVGAMLCYMPVCLINLIYSIIVVVSEKDNKLVRFHAFQSLLLMAALIVIYIALVIVTVIISMISGTLAMLFSLLTWVLMLGVFGLAIFMCIKAYGGDKTKLPVIGDMADKWA